MIAEARQSMLLQRVAYGADAMSAREALEIATRGGADVLNRPDCGRLEVGKCADIAIWDMSGIDAAGNWDLGAVLLAGPVKAKHTIINGKQVVRDYQLTTLDLPVVVEQQQKLARRLADQTL